MVKNVPEIKLGVVVGSTDWLPSEIAEDNRKKLLMLYKEKYGDDGVYECPIVITDNEVNIKRAMKDIMKAGCDAVCIYYANYGPESAGTLFAQEFLGPVMMFAAAEEGVEPFVRQRTDGMSGFINACYALKLRQTKVYIPPKPIGTIEQCIEMIHGFIPIARTLIAIQNLKLIVFGPRPSSYLASCAPNNLLYDIGVEVSEYSELELLDSFKKHEGDNRIENVVSEMETELGENKTPNVLSNLAQYETTVEDWVRNHKGTKKFVAMTSTCWPAFPGNFGFVPCYVNSRLTTKGIPVACEVDAYGAVSEYIGQCISNDVVTILNMNNNIPETLYIEKIKGRLFDGNKYELDDLFLGYHCGVTPSCKLTSSTLDYHFVNQQLIGEEHSMGAVHGTIVESPITLFRIQGTKDGRLHAYVVQGYVLPVEMSTYGGRGIIAVHEFGRFFRNVVLEKHFPNHCAVLFGHYGKELMGLLGMLGIKDVEYNHQKGCPYDGENIYQEW